MGRPLSDASAPSYLTLLLGRAQWGIKDGCEFVPPGAVTLDRVAAELSQRGLSATGAVVVDRIAVRERACEGTVVYPTWDDLARLRDRYRWTFVSNGTTHDDITRMTEAEQRAESCGSLEPLVAAGHRRAWGLFAYGNDKHGPRVQAEVVADCFAWGRRYGDRTNRQADIGPPWFAHTVSVNGGRCEEGGRSCSRDAGRKRYASPERLRELMRPGPGEWRIVQLYRFVEGRRLRGFSRWDCTANDWRSHWTSLTELYCLDDFLRAVDAIPDDVVVTDPASVGEAWGRRPGR